LINYYYILGLSQSATQAEIKTAYRKLALRYHPDKNGGSSYAEERFKQISEAYRVLSNPRKKARHDWSLEYEAYQQTQPAWNYTPPRQETTTYTQARPQYTRRKRPPLRYTSRHNIIATAWAFSIFFAVALVVVSVSLWNSHRLAELEAERNQQAREVYMKAEQHYQSGLFEESLLMLREAMENASVAPQASQLHASILQRLEDDGLQHYRQGNFAEAAQLLQLVANHVDEYRPIALAHLVASYEGIQDYEGAIQAYKLVIKAEPRTIEARNRLARIYAEHYKDFDTALQYYQQASELVTDQYRTEYGNAYAITVNPAKTPDSHYQLHCGLAQVYISQGMLQQAESALKWAIFLRPDEPLAFYLQGIKNREAKNMTAACESWSEAVEKGSEQANELLKEYCEQQATP
jgi:tetratricopeptide (TPR) repeat protein